jgi:hypothetical protein
MTAFRMDPSSHIETTESRASGHGPDAVGWLELCLASG